MSKFENSEYFKSKEHLENVKKASILGLEVLQEIKNERISDYNINPKLCKTCNKPLPYEDHNQKTFCNSSCAAKYNNKNRRQSEETKAKISEKLQEYYKVHECKSFFIFNKTNNESPKTKICVICNEEFLTKKENGKKYKGSTCSTKCCTKLKSNNSKRVMSNIIKDGKHKGWTTRNITSYPERFFIEVLKNNNLLEYCKINYPIEKCKLDSKEKYSYFLDFYFEDLKLDLEIDGKQHNNRKEQDLKRDELLTKSGIIVYRITWKNINTKNGKLYIKNEIDKFLNYYKSLK